MNSKRLVLAIVVVFVGMWATDFLIHQVWLQKDYVATLSLWRPEGDMQKHMGWIFAGQFLAAVAFVVIWSRGFPTAATLGGSITFGLFMGLFSEATTLILYAVQPMPANLAAKWFIAGVVRGALMGSLVYLVGRPKPIASAPPV